MTRLDVRLLVALIVLVLVTACGSPGDVAAPPPTATGAPDRAAATQTLTIVGGGSLPTTLDPALLRDAESSFLARQVFRGLMRLDDDLIVEPDIAAAVEASPDGLRYTFTLRDGATFQDGTTIDAGAVKQSFERAADPALAGGDGSALPAAIYFGDIDGIDDYLRGRVDSISGIRIVDPRTIEFTLSRPAANFLYKLTGSPAAIVDAAKAAKVGWWKAANGSGPFRITEFSAQRIVLTRFEKFYDGAPRLERVVVLYGSAAAQPLNLYETGAIDLTDVPLFALDRVSSPADPLYPQLESTPQLSTSFIVLNPAVEPFDDPAIRKAVAQALDRKKVSRVMLEDRVRLANGLVPPGMLDREWPATPQAYDLAAARAELASAQPYEIAPAFYGGGVSVVLAQVLDRDLGLRSDAIALEWGEFSAALSSRELPAFALSWIADYPDPANFLDALFHSRSPDNYSGYSNAMVDDLLDQAAIEQNPDRRAELYLRAQQQIIDDGVLIPLYHDVAYTLVKPWVRGLTITPLGIISLEDVWIGEH